MIQQIIFVIVFITAMTFFFRRIRAIRNNIMSGQAQNLSDQPWKRLTHMLLFAFGQKKMFRKPIPAVLHFVVYAGFLLINLEVLEILIDGLLGHHRSLHSLLGDFYPTVIGFFELLAVGVIIACIVFLIRRNVLKIPRFHSPEMHGWPFRDANIILWVEIILMVAILVMNAADLNLQELGSRHYPQVGAFVISQNIASLFNGLSENSLIFLERAGWWTHLLGILWFINYVPYSKHLHIFLAFPNAYYADLHATGEMRDMPVVAQEVKQMMQPDAAQDIPPLPEDYRFGAKDANDLSWKNLLDAYSCTECGRCTSVCPANQTGKILSPRKIMMDTRDRIEAIGQNNGESDENTLYGHYISKEELLACTTCNACVQECPVSINPLDIILQMRRYVAMEEAGTPAEWNTMFTNLENNQAPWPFSPQDRMKWTTND